MTHWSTHKNNMHPSKNCDIQLRFISHFQVEPGIRLRRAITGSSTTTHILGKKLSYFL